VTWLTPLTGAILAAAIVPPLVLLYFLKLRRRPRPIACTLLWQRSVEDLQANAPFQRLRRSLLLFLQLLALLLLAASVMQPQIESNRNRRGKTVILIDNSASMEATDVERDDNRLAEAKRRARELVESLYSGGVFSSATTETMIISFSDRARVCSRFSKSRQELLDAIDAIRPTHGQTRIDEALKLARAYTTNVDPDSDRAIGEPADLELFTDGGIADLDEQVLRGEHLTYHRVGTPDADNVAVVTLAVERPYERPGAVEVFAALVNFNDEEVVCDVQLSVDDTTRAVQEVRLPAAATDAGTGVRQPGRNNVVFTPFDQPRGAIIEVANTREDALGVDNVAQVVVPPPKRLRVALVAPKSFVIRSVLEGMPLEPIEVLSTRQFERLAQSGGLETYDVIVLDDYAPPEGLLPPGRYLCFGPPPPVEGLNAFGENASQFVLNVRDDHPVLRFVNLDAVIATRTVLIQPDADIDVLVEGSRAPMLLGISRGPLQLIYVPFDPLDSNWPFQRSFVTFVFNAVEYLGNVGSALTDRGFVPGEALSTRLKTSATSIELGLPDGDVERLDGAYDPTALSWGPIRLTGVHLLSWDEPGVDGRETRPFAVNLDGEAEARIRTPENLEVGQEQFAGAIGADSAYTPLWPWAIGLCLAVLTFEWWVYHRKAYI
jgi:hypothetical protein